MKAQVKFEWRKYREPENYEDAAWVIKNALQAAGYSVASMPDVQGVWDEDKPERLGGKWDEQDYHTRRWPNRPRPRATDKSFEASSGKP